MMRLTLLTLCAFACFVVASSAPTYLSRNARSSTHITANDFLCGTWTQTVGPSGSVSPIEEFELKDEISYTNDPTADPLQVDTQAFFKGVIKDSNNTEYPVRVTANNNETYTLQVSLTETQECLHVTIAVDIMGLGSLGVIHGQVCKEDGVGNNPEGHLSLMIVDDSGHGKDVHRYTYERSTFAACTTGASFDYIEQLYRVNQQEFEQYDWELQMGIPNGNGPSSVSGGFHTWATRYVNGNEFVLDCVGVYTDFDPYWTANQIIKVALGCAISIPHVSNPQIHESNAFVGTMRLDSGLNDNFEYMNSFMVEDLPETFIVPYFYDVYNNTSP